MDDSSTDDSENSEKCSLQYESAMEAVLAGNEIKLREALNKFEEDFDPHKICRNGTTLACTAVKTRDLDLLKIILGDTKKMKMCCSGSSQKRLKKNESDIKFCTRDADYFACYYRSTFKIESHSDYTYTFEMGSRGTISQLDNFGKNILHYAIISDDVEMVDYLLKSFEELRGNQLDISINSPLHLAVGKDNTEMVKLLLSFGSSVYLRDSEGKTPLHIASERGSADMISILLDANADINALDQRGQSTLMLATIYNHCSAAEILLKRGVKVNYEDDLGFTALKRAVFVNNSKVTKILVDNGARICESLNLLHYAAIYDQFDIIESLLHGGARLETRNSKGATPLMLAIEYKSFEMVEFLLKKGANPNTLNSISDTTSLHISMFHIEETGVIEKYIDILLKYGADLYKRSRYGFDALYYAFLHRNDAAACHLIKSGMDVNFRHKLANCDYLTSCIRHSRTTSPIDWLMYSGFNMLNYETRFNEKDKMNEKEIYLYNFLCKPLLLKDLCRIHIRRVVKHKDISALPLPDSVQKFLRLETM